MIPFFIIIILIYALLIGSFSYGFHKLKKFKLRDVRQQTKFSVIIPFRDEADNLESLLASILHLNYAHSLFEILFINDYSSDNSVAIIKHFKSTNTTFKITILDNLRTSNAPKKDAITLGNQHAENEWIITTDADCKVPKFWLDSFDDFIQLEDPDFLAGPVGYTDVNSFLKRFQTLDFLSLIGSTIGGFGIGKPFLCNGANLAYKKSLFQTLNGFEGNSNISSGDDIFLLEKALQFAPKNVQYLKCQHAIVLTKPVENFKALISQRIRWASKTTSYSNGFGKLSGFVVLLSNASIIAMLILTILGLFQANIVLDLFIIKFSIDFLLLFKVSRFFGQDAIIKSYALAGLIYPFFAVYVAIISMFSSYKWKGRRFSK